MKKETLNELALFAGAGGGILASHLLGWRTVCAVEWEAYPASVLVARQNEKILPPFPIWDDVQTFDGKPWRGIVDVVSGGFPCQDISSAGKGAGIEGERSGMWREMARIIGEVRPKYAFVENSPMLVTRGLDRVLADLASLRYDCRWDVISASNIGANHERKRIWIIARNTDSNRKSRQPINEETQKLLKFSRGNVTNTDSTQCKGGKLSGRETTKNAAFSYPRWWQDTSPLHRVDDGVPARMDRLKAIGNGQVPAVAATAWRLLNAP